MRNVNDGSGKLSLVLKLCPLSLICTWHQGAEKHRNISNTSVCQIIHTPCWNLSIPDLCVRSSRCLGVKLAEKPMMRISLSHETANREKYYFWHQQTQRVSGQFELHVSFHIKSPERFPTDHFAMCQKNIARGPGTWRNRDVVKPSAFYPELLSVGNHWGLTPGSPHKTVTRFFSSGNALTWWVGCKSKRREKIGKNQERGKKIKVGASSVAANLLHMEGMAFPCKICPPPLCVSIVLQMMMNLSTFTRICLHSVVCARSSR